VTLVTVIVRMSPATCFICNVWYCPRIALQFSVPRVAAKSYKPSKSHRSKCSSAGSMNRRTSLSTCCRPSLPGVLSHVR
jgi:hypothetical protein